MGLDKRIENLGLVSSGLPITLDDLRDGLCENPDVLVALRLRHLRAPEELNRLDQLGLSPGLAFLKKKKQNAERKT